MGCGLWVVGIFVFLVDHYGYALIYQVKFKNKMNIVSVGVNPFTTNTVWIVSFSASF